MDNSEYKELYVLVGASIEEVVLQLQYYQKRGCKACAEFNGVTLYSDTVTVDSAYVAITGGTKAEYDARWKAERERYIQRENEHKARIPKLIEEWKEKSRLVLDEKYWSHWDEILPVRLSDLYHGMELPMCLDIIKALNDGRSLKEAKKIIDEQGHSGMSYHLVRVMVKELCDRGADFYEYTE